MGRQFRTVDYAATLARSVRLRDCLAADHLARFIAEVLPLLDFAPLYARYGHRGGAPYRPELLCGRLVYGYATGVFSSRKIEAATYESAPFRFLAGNQHPDHDTLASFRKTVLPELQQLFVQVLLLAQETGLLQVGNISVDGTKMHAHAAKRKAVSYQRLTALATPCAAAIAAWFTLAEEPDRGRLPDGLVVAEEVARRQDRLARLAAAKRALAARAAARTAAEQAGYDDKLAARADRQQRTGRGPGGRAPVPSIPGPRPTDQDNVTDPESRIMKHCTNQGGAQQYNGQIAVTQDSRLLVGHTVAHHPNDYAEAVPTVESIPTALGTPTAAALDTGFCSAKNIAGLAARGIRPLIATGREAHHRDWQTRFAAPLLPPPAAASPCVKMAYALQTPSGKAMYRLRKSTVEPVFGSIKATLGFRQCSLRGLAATAGEWSVVCLAYNLRRLHTLVLGVACVLGGLAR